MRLFAIRSDKSLGTSKDLLLCKVVSLCVLIISCFVPLAQAQGQGRVPGNPGWWGVRPPCPNENATCATQWTVTLADLQSVLRMIPAARQSCNRLSDPRLVTACLLAVTSIVKKLRSARKDNLAALTLLGQQRELVTQMVNVADQNNFGGLAQIVDPAAVAQLAAQALEVSGLGDAAITQSGKALASITEAGRAAHTIPALIHLARALDVSWGLHTHFLREVTFVANCHERTAHAIAVIAAVALGIRFPPVAGPGPENWLLVWGLYHPQAMAFYSRPSNHIVIDLDSYGSLADGTRHEYFGYMNSREVHREIAVLLQHDRELRLARDVWVPEPLTLLPMLLARAGDPIEVALGGVPAEEVARVRASNGTVQLLWARWDLTFREVDADGNPLGPTWTHCFGWPGLGCPLSIQTDASPEDIAAGRVISSYYEIDAGTGGLVDPFNGNPAEARVCYRLSVHKRAERPDNPCYVWDYTLQRYVWRC